MDNDRIIEKEDLLNGKYAGMLEHLKTSNDVMGAAVEFILAVGGIRKDVLEFLAEHPYTDKKVFLGTRRLFHDGADVAWFQFIFEVAQDKEAPKLYMFLDEIIYAYNDGIPLDRVRDYYHKCNNVYEMGFARKQITGAEGTSYQDVMETLNGIIRVLEELNEDNSAYKDKTQKLEEYIRSQNEKAVPDEEVRKENVRLREEIKQKQEKIEKLTSEREMYQEHYYAAKKNYSQLKESYMQLKMELQKKELKRPSEQQESRQDQTSILDLIKENSEKMEILQAQINSLLKQPKEPSTEEIFEYISEKFSSLESRLEETFENHGETNYLPEEKNVVHAETHPDIRAGMAQSEEEEGNLPGVRAKMAQGEKEERTHPDVRAEMTQSEIEEELPAVDFSPGEVEFMERKEEEEEQRILFFEKFLKKFLKKSFKKKTKTEQKEALFRKMLDLNYGKEQIDCVKNAIKSGNSYEFIYELLENNVTLAELQSLCEISNTG